MSQIAKTLLSQLKARPTIFLSWGPRNILLLDNGIQMDVRGQAFQGRVIVTYDEGPDSYTITMGKVRKRQGVSEWQEMKVISDIYVDNLHEAIDGYVEQGRSNKKHRRNPDSWDLCLKCSMTGVDPADLARERQCSSCHQYLCMHVEHLCQVAKMETSAWGEAPHDYEREKLLLQDEPQSFQGVKENGTGSTCIQCQEMGLPTRGRVFYDPRIGASLCASCSGVEEEDDLPF